jgi:hypothetical protein
MVSFLNRNVAPLLNDLPLHRMLLLFYLLSPKIPRLNATLSRLRQSRTPVPMQKFPLHGILSRPIEPTNTHLRHSD